jgi:gluconolactonase
MKKLAFLCFAAAMLFAFMYAADEPVMVLDTNNHPVIGEIIRLDPRFDKLIPAGAKLEVVASGFDWSEGPVWDKKGGYLLFSDIPRNAIMKWKEGEGVSVFMKPSGYTGVAEWKPEPGSNGLVIDAQGRLILCEHGDRRISRLEPESGKRTLVDNYEGKRLNSPNDAVLAANGDLYFTDPPYGLPKRWDDPRRELDFCGVYRLSPNGKLTLLTKEMTRPNGIGLSPDDKTLYVSQSDAAQAIWRAFPINADGTLGKSRIVHDVTAHMGKMPGSPDGLAIDKDGNVFATGPGGVYVFAPDDTLLGRISSGQRNGNATWGGDDGSTLYIASDMYICRIKTNTKGIGW